MMILRQPVRVVYSTLAAHEYSISVIIQELSEMDSYHVKQTVKL